MTSAQRSDNLSRAEETKGALWAAPTRAKESLSSVHASLLVKHVSYAVIVEIAEAFRRHHPSKLAKQAAYSLLYAVPSAVIVLVSLTAIIDKNTGAGVSEALFTFISEQAPAELQPLLEALVQRAVVETSESEAVLAALVSLGIAVWGGAAGVGALIDAINSVYGIRNTRSFIKGTALKLGLMLLGGAMVIGSFILLTFGRQLGERLAGAAGRGMTLVNVLSSGPVWALLLLSASLLLLYWLAPDIQKSIRWVLPGTALATLAILIVFAAMDLILGYSNPGTAYGAAGSVLVLLWSLFLLSTIVIVGGIVNAVLGRRYDRKLRDSLRRHPEKRLEHGEIAVSVYR
jgi:membrane protein